MEKEIDIDRFGKLLDYIPTLSVFVTVILAVLEKSLDSA
jgi:hypothetical protein